MRVIGSIIARLGSKRLPYKNILPFGKDPLVGMGIEKLRKAKLVDEIVVSTESELIARIAQEYGALVLERPPELAKDDTPSIPVFEHIIDHFQCDIHVNYNINFPLCDPQVIDRAIELVEEHQEVLSNPFAVWAQTPERIKNYINPWDITAFRFDDNRCKSIDIHYENELLECYRVHQNYLDPWKNSTRKALQKP